MYCQIVLFYKNSIMSFLLALIYAARLKEYQVVFKSIC